MFAVVLAACGLIQSAQALPKLTVPQLAIKKMGVFETGVRDESATEIVARDKKSKRLYVTSSHSNSIHVLHGKLLKKVASIDLTEYGSPNSVDVRDGLVAVAVEADPKQEPGHVVFFDSDGKYITKLQVGPLPDHVMFSPDGTKILVALEGEPNDDYTVDPEGGVAIIDLTTPYKKMTQDNVRLVDFKKFNDVDIDPEIRIFGPNASVAQDLEPEFIAVSADSKTAWVVCQENNAIAIVDIETAEVTDLVALGTKDFNTIYTELDVSDKDGKVQFGRWPVRGMFQPDMIQAYEVDGETYLVTANEGDARDYAGFSEETRVADLTLSDALLEKYGADLQDESKLGRMKTTTVNGKNEDGVTEEIYAYGGRSFSIWDAKGNLVWDSGSQLAKVVAATDPDLFPESRSDDKGIEPEAIELGKIGGTTFAFVGLERAHGIAVYDVSIPWSPFFVTYMSLYDAQEDPDNESGHHSPEGILFVPQGKNKGLLYVANEHSGTVTSYRIGLRK